MRLSKKILYPVLLTLAFSLGAIGHLFLHPAPPEEIPVTLTLHTETISARLLPTLPDEGTVLTLYGRPCLLTARWEEPQSLLSRENGRSQITPSRLVYTLTLTVSLRAHTKEGRLYLGDRLLLRGDEVALSGDNLVIYATLLDYSVHF